MRKKNSKKRTILVIDNYDSFVYNLVHYLEEFDCEVTVKRNDAFTIDEVALFDKVLLSPGPGLPEEAGMMNELIRKYSGSLPIMGVCLGHQAIAQVFGGKLINLERVFHGVSTKAFILSKNEPLFRGMDQVIEIGRYHSWIVSREDFPEELEITSVDENNQIMSFRHKTLDICAVQFHPESVLTPNGKQIIMNWVES